jgi:hypothetical protein
MFWWRRIDGHGLKNGQLQGMAVFVGYGKGFFDAKKRNRLSEMTTCFLGLE